MIQTQAGTLFEKAAKSLGYHPFLAYGACHYCGYCERFGCEVNAKASRAHRSRKPRASPARVCAADGIVAASALGFRDAF